MRFYLQFSIANLVKYNNLCAKFNNLSLILFLGISPNFQVEMDLQQFVSSHATLALIINVGITQIP